MRVDFHLLSSLILCRCHRPTKYFRCNSAKCCDVGGWIYVSSWQTCFFFLMIFYVCFLFNFLAACFQFGCVSLILHPFCSERHQHETNQPATAPRSLSKIYKNHLSYHCIICLAACGRLSWQNVLPSPQNAVFLVTVSLDEHIIQDQTNSQELFASISSHDAPYCSSTFPTKETCHVL